MIPPQLQNAAFRLIKVATKSKRPIEKDWQDTANYGFEDPAINDHITKAGNYGVICGPGGLRVLDCDELERLRTLGILDRFPRTFTVQSREGRAHRYYLIPELEKKIVLFDPILKDENGQPLHLGEIQGPGTQVIGPGSIHQTTGLPYQVIDDSPIAAMSLADVKAAIEGLKSSRLEANCAKLEALPRHKPPTTEEDPFKNISIEDIAYPKGDTRRIGNEIQGAHPKHGSTTGKNFRIDLKKNTWYCDRCHTGGGPALWLAVQNNIISCDRAGSGALRGEDFREVWKIAEKEGLIPKSGPTFKKLEKRSLPKEPDIPTELSLSDVADEHEIQAGPRKGACEYVFNPDKAADAIINSLHIVSTPDEKIWVYQEGYYRPEGKTMVDRLLDRAAGKQYTINASKETLKKIFLRTMVEFTALDPNPYLLCVRNGVVDLLTGNVLEHDPKYYITSACPIAYDPDTKPKEFINFLETACSNDDDRTTLIDWLVACAVMAEFEYLLFLTGHGSNGKHVYEAILQAFFGSESTEAINLEELMNSKFAMGYLRRARICISSETNPDKTKTELIKKISGNDWMSSDVKNKDRVRFKAYTQLIFDSNSMPIFEDTSYGFTRRFTRVVMPYMFVDVVDTKDSLQRKKDPHILEKLTSDVELSGILNLVIERAKTIALDKKIHRKSDSFARYEEQSYSVSDFLDKFVEFDSDKRHNEDYQISSDVLFSKFEEYTKYMIGAKASRKKFSMMVGKENGEASRTVRILEMPVRGFRGLKFFDMDFDEFIERKKLEYTPICNVYNDPLTISNEDNNSKSRNDVTIVTVYHELLESIGINGLSLSVRASKETIVTTCVTEPVDSEKSIQQNESGIVSAEMEDILKRSLSIMQRGRKPVTPHVLAIHCENLDMKMPTRTCTAWLKGGGWKEAVPGWEPPTNGGRTDDIVERALKSIELNHGKLDNFTLADKIRSMGGDMTTVECKTVLIEKGLMR